MEGVVHSFDLETFYLIPVSFRRCPMGGARMTTRGMINKNA